MLLYMESEAVVNATAVSTAEPPQELPLDEEPV
jgi:hypothetical protein